MEGRAKYGEFGLRSGMNVVGAQHLVSLVKCIEKNVGYCSKSIWPLNDNALSLDEW